MASQAHPPKLARSLHLFSVLATAVLGLSARPAAAQAPSLASAAAASSSVPSMTQELLDRATLRIEPGRHAATVTRIAAGGGRVVTASEDRTVRIWDGATGELVRTLRPPSAAEGEEGRLYALALSPDGRLIATAGSTRFADDAEQRTASVYLLDAGTGELVRRLPGAPFAGAPHHIARVAFSPDGKSLASGSLDKTIKLWNVVSGQEIATLKGHAHFVNSVAFTPDGRTLASGSSDRTIKLWNMASGQETLTLNGHSDFVYPVAFSPDSKTLASGSGAKTIRLWRAATG